MPTNAVKCHPPNMSIKKAMAAQAFISLLGLSGSPTCKFHLQVEYWSHDQERTYPVDYCMKVIPTPQVASMVLAHLITAFASSRRSRRTYLISLNCVLVSLFAVS